MFAARSGDEGARALAVASRAIESSLINSESLAWQSFEAELVL
ncbi:hypothetical protein [Paraburkholderia sp. JPY419]